MLALTIAGVGSLAAGALLAGCLAQQGPLAVEQEDLMITHFYVEGSIQYLGISDRWAGPQTMSVYFSAKEPGNARVAVTPPTLAQGWLEYYKAARLPAASGGSEQGVRAPVLPMKSEELRERMATLASGLQSLEVPFRGCLHPIKVRLVKTNGNVLEKEGCRASTGWPQLASELTSDLIRSASIPAQQEMVTPPPATPSPPAIRNPSSVAVPQGQSVKAEWKTKSQQLSEEPIRIHSSAPQRNFHASEKHAGKKKRHKKVSSTARKLEKNFPRN